MISTIIMVEPGKYQVSVDFADEGVGQTTSNTVRGTEEQANAYAVTLARDFRDNHADLFPAPVIEVTDPMEEM